MYATGSLLKCIFSGVEGSFCLEVGSTCYIMRVCMRHGNLVLSFCACNSMMCAALLASERSAV
jgi:hypothetical protein